jgi:methylated-DNA-[protein]-cysteine S-methyltransferase
METLHYALIPSEVGKLSALVTDKGLCALEFDRPNRQAMLQGRISKWFSSSQIAESGHPVLESVKAWLQHYFAARFRELEPLPLDLRGTDFERQIWNLLLDIPLGSTMTYGELARKLNRPNGARAVGLAVGRNPVGIVVPCHRVVGSDGSLTGYGGGLDRKRWLLEHECSAAPLFRSASNHG